MLLSKLLNLFFPQRTGIHGLPDRRRRSNLDSFFFKFFKKLINYKFILNFQKKQKRMTVNFFVIFFYGRQITLVRILVLLHGVCEPDFMNSQ